MEQILDDFKNYMINTTNKSENTIKSYILHISAYIKWFQDTYGTKFKKLYRKNVLEYKSYLTNIRKYRSKPLDGRTINAKLGSLGLFNKFLIEKKIQNDFVIKDDNRRYGGEINLGRV